MPETQRQIDKARKDILHAFIAISVLFFLVVLFFAYFVRQNSQRIHDVQNSRISSCVQTYSGIEDVFGPFLPKKPRTHKQEVQINKFHKVIDTLKAGCVLQTKPNQKPPKQKDRHV